VKNSKQIDANQTNIQSINLSIFFFLNFNILCVRLAALIKGLYKSTSGYLPYKVKVVIAGNHDLTLDENLSELNMESFGISKSDIKSYLKARGINSVKEMLSSAVYLQDSSVSICGIKIYGSPW
jgi:hypothetical protein